MTADPRSRFDPAADDYHRCRPTYPDALVDWVLSEAGLADPGRVADIGCGTGIATRLFAARGHDVTGVDPSEPMLERARVAGGARYQRGEASATGLPEACFDLVIVAQAFHWFDLEPALAEIARILAPGGAACAFWNVRAESPFLQAYDALLRRFSSEYEKRPQLEATCAAIRASPRVRDCREARFSHEQRLDRAGILGRAHSSSYVVHGVADKPAFDRELGALFDAHQRDGSVVLPYRTLALLWRMRA